MTTPTQKTVLLTLGRLPVALELARAFAAAGWRVLVADPFAMHLARMSRCVAVSYRVTAPSLDARAYLRELCDIARRESVRLVVPVSEESMHVAALAGELPDETELFCMHQAQMLTLHDKFEFNRLAARLGLAVPPSALPRSPEATEIRAAGPFVVKPRYSCSGRALRYYQAGDAGDDRGDTLVQALLPGRQFSSFSIARHGRVVATAVYRGAVMSGSVAVCFERLENLPAIDRWIETFVAGTGHSGFIAFDFIEDAAGVPAAIECNPRATSGMHFIRSERLAGLISEGARAGHSLREDRLLAESYSCFTAALASLFRRREFAERLSWLHRARDITWSARDPWPFLLMLINSHRLVATAIRHRESFAQAAVRDIEWQPPIASA